MSTAMNQWIQLAVASGWIAAVIVATGVGFVRSAVVVVLFNWWRQQAVRARRSVIYRVGYGAGQFISELRAAAAVIAVDGVVIGSWFAIGAIELAPSTWGRSILTFIIIGAWFELWFYLTHRLMHTRRFYFLHRQHHTAKVCHPLTAMSFSVAERLILVLGALGFAALVSQVLPLSRAGLGAYFLVNFLLNVLGHSNVDPFPARFLGTVTSRWLITPTFHAMHHARLSGHYGLFTPFLDRWFGTAFADYPAVFAAVKRGDGPQRLGQRMVDVDLLRRNPVPTDRGADVPRPPYVFVSTPNSPTKELV